MDQIGSSGRRGILRGGAAMMGAAGLAGGLAAPMIARADGNEMHRYGLSRGDIAILKFLSAAEQIETDLWQQYTEIAEGNSAFATALSVLDGDVVVYSADVTEDELSHAQFLNAYLAARGAEPVDLSPFRTLPSPHVKGARQVRRLTNLTSLSVDTSYFTRYRGTGNPDLGAVFPQIARIVKQPGIPTSNSVSSQQMQGIAFVAGFHFASIEQGGTSLYNTMVGKVTSPEVLHIVSSIYATEAIHYAVFGDILDNIPGFDNGEGTLVVPDLTGGKHRSNHVFPHRCQFLREDLPTVSVIRPGEEATAGAVASALALTRSGLFKGQSTAFFDALFALARDADAASRPF